MLKIPDSEKSLWRDAYPESIYDALNEDLEVDLVVVGGGITGLTAAYLAKKSGLKVAVLEKSSVGGGTTGRTTGKVTSQHNIIYSELVKNLGNKKARTYADANQAALQKINEIVRIEGIDCNWQRDDNYVFTDKSDQIKLFRHEAEIAGRLGLPASFETETPLPFKVKAAVKFSAQGKIHSQRYLLGLAAAVNGERSYIFENSRVTGIRDGEHCRVKTKNGTVHAKNVIVATSVPTLPLMARGGYCILEYPTESYIVCGPLNSKVTGMYISPDKNHHSILPTEINGQKHLLIGGEAHVSGLRGSRQARFQRLANYAQKRFGLESITHSWSDRDYLAYDGLPLIGKLYPWSKHVYVGSAYRKWGLTNGTAAAMILIDLITGQRNDWASAFTPNRLKPIISIPKVVASYIVGKGQ